MIDVLPTLAENITMVATSNPDAVYTSWGMINQLVIMMVILGGFVGWAIGYQCYRLGIRFPWHKED